MKRGIVIGKFYPPHKGHQYLMEQALFNVDELTAIVCDKKGQTISGALRASWIKEMLPQVNVVVVDDILADDDSEGWAKYTLETLRYVPDVVFTSEDYGHRYAQFMGSNHVLIDKIRKNVPISATKIRESPFTYWDFLPPCVKAFFAKRISIVGAESTGTTTLALALAKHYNTNCVMEFGRIYTEENKKAFEDHWTTNDFVTIAEQQNSLEDMLARDCNKILICDTDSFATSLWHERYLGFSSANVDGLSHGRRYSLRIITDIDIPFVQDGTRDGQHVREKMHERFVEELRKKKEPYIIVSGNHENRLKCAIESCDKIKSSH